MQSPMRIEGSILAIVPMHDDRRPPMRESGAPPERRGFGGARELKKGLPLKGYRKDEELENCSADGDLIPRLQEATFPCRRTAGGGFTRRDPWACVALG